jgi:hypothetical protein
LSKHIRLPEHGTPFTVLLARFNDIQVKISSEHLFTVTLPSDSTDEPVTLQTAFADAWAAAFQTRPVPVLNSQADGVTSGLRKVFCEDAFFGMIDGLLA